MTNEEFAKWLQAEKKKRKKQTNIAVLSVIGCVAFVIILTFYFGNAVDEPVVEEKVAETVSSSTKETPEDVVLRLKNQLTTEIEQLEKTFDNSAYTGSVESLQMELILFNAWAQLLMGTQSHPDHEIKELADRLGQKVVKLQEREFPLLRKKYGDEAGRLVWEDDIYVKVTGKRNEYITFTSTAFTTNKNIKTFHDQVIEVLKQFRYKEARYEWYKNSGDYQILEINSPDDTALYVI